MKKTRIQFSKPVQEIAISLCQQIQKSASKNPQALKMSGSISAQVKKHGGLTAKQIYWICTNARFNKINVPDGFSALIGTGKANVMKMVGPDGVIPADIGIRLLRQLKRIEKVLLERLPL